MDDAKTIFVTGAASGIGRHLVGRFLDQGHQVTAADVRQAALDEAARDDGWDAQCCHRVTLDVRDYEAWREAVAAAVTRDGRLDVLLNVAGTLRSGRVQEVTSDDVDLLIDVNLKGVIHGTRAAVEVMLPRGAGHIINIASLAGITAVPGLTLYSTSKFGVRAFSLAAAFDLAETGVSVTVICPDAVETPMLTIQERDPNAELTFSGPRPLQVDEVGEAVDRALAKRPLEILLPWGRGIQAKIANVFPSLSSRIEKGLRKKGRKAQARRGRQLP